MTEHSESRAPTESEGFSEPSEEVKRRNRITGFVLLAIVLGMIAMAMIVRAYGS